MRIHGVPVLGGTLLALSARVTVEWSGTGEDSKLSFIPPSIYHRFPLLVSDTVNPNVMAGALV